MVVIFHGIIFFLSSGVFSRQCERHRGEIKMHWQHRRIDTQFPLNEKKQNKPVALFMQLINGC